MFDAKQAINTLINEIKAWFEANAPKATAVLGISGGKDSTITAALLKRALGADRVFGVMMPCGTQSDIADSKKAINALEIRYTAVNIGESYDTMQYAFARNGFPVSKDAQVNLQPRLRMSALYMVAQSLPEGGIVINTCNRSEDYVGYATKFGDCAGDVSILGNYLVSEILAIGDNLPEIPNELVHKAPSDGLWGVTDEDKLGFTYDELDQYILTGKSGDPAKDAKMDKMYRSSRHKYVPMPLLGVPTK